MPVVIGSGGLGSASGCPILEGATAYVGFDECKEPFTNYFLVDGTADNVQIQQAIAYLTAGRTWKERVLLVGNFTIESSLLVPSYTILELDGSVTLADNSDVDMIQNADGSNSYIDIIGGYWNGNFDNQASGNGISFTEVSWSNIRFVHFRDIQDYALYMYTCTTTFISDSVFGHNCGGRAIYWYIVSDCMMERVWAASAGCAFLFRFGSSNMISDLYLGYGGGEATYEAEMLLLGARNNVFENIIVDTTEKHGLALFGADDDKCYNNQFTNLRITRPVIEDGWHALYLDDDCERNNFTNIYGGQKGEPDDTAFSWGRVIYETGSVDHNQYVNVIARDYTTPYQLVGTDSKIINADPRIRNSGVATILNGNGSIVVTHNLAGTPNIVVALGEHAETSDVICTAKAAANFTLTVPANVTANRAVNWDAEYKP